MAVFAGLAVEIDTIFKQSIEVFKSLFEWILVDPGRYLHGWEKQLVTIRILEECTRIHFSASLACQENFDIVVMY